ncbi:MAG: DUF2442 domain-containing protein [Plesiomonas sp.]
MKSELLGTNTSAEVMGLTVNGLWLFAQGEEHFLPFEQYPWFRNAPVTAVFNVECEGPDGLHWPELDVDLSVDSIRHPEKYPLRSRAGL